MNAGKIDTVSGAAGGVKYICGLSKEEIKKFTEQLCAIMKDKERIIPGNFLYLTDIMFNPQIIHKAAVILASSFINENVDCVVTVETKGVPLAYEVAKLLNVKLVVVRRENKVTEGSTVSINYISGSTKKIQNMSLSKRALKKHSRCIFIDDFMKGGGTASGIIDLLKEFDSELCGIGILVDNIEMDKKLVRDYTAIINFNGFDENGEANLTPSQKL